MGVGIRILALTLGGACGVNARYWLSLLVARGLGVRFPWATILINVSGSFLIGFGAIVLAERWPHPLVRIFVLTGFLGGYTTFSAYLFESFTLWERGDRSLAAGNLFGSLSAGLLAVVLGVAVGRWLIEPAVPTKNQATAMSKRLETIDDAIAGQEPPAEPIG